MLSSLHIIDLVVVIGLIIFLVVASMYSSFKKKSAEEYFMAGRSLRWWSVAGSIFGTNIHAQQIIGMMSVGFSFGFAQSHYEVWAVPAILVLAYIFIPIYRKRNFFTLSQFLESRYNSKTRLAYTVLMVTFILITLMGGLYIGSRTLGILTEGTTFEISYMQGIVLIAIVTVAFTIFGGMESVVIVDNILTVIMILAVVLMGTLTYMQPEIGGLSGLLKIDAADAQKMHLYLPANHPKLPWLGIFTGLTILNFFYWTTNQYQVQRVLAAATEKDAKIGSLAAGFLKLLIPFFSIAVGTAAYYLFKARYGVDVIKPDDTFLTLLKTVVPQGYGFVGLILAGLTCAIFSAIYSMMNSVSTMMAYDIFKKYISPDASDKATVNFGRWSVFVICILAALLTPLIFDPSSKDNFFLKIANITSYIKPGLVVTFFWGVLWRKTHPSAAILVLLCSPLVGFGIDAFYANFLTNFEFVRTTFGENLNFLYRVFLISLVDSVVVYTFSSILNKDKDFSDENELVVSLSSMKETVLPFILLHTPFILLGINQIVSVQNLALLATPLTMLLFLYYKQKYDKPTPILQADIFYAGLLTSCMVFIMYFFA